MNDSLYPKDWRLYTKYEWYRTLDERATDLTAVRRGFARELLGFVEYANRRRKEYGKKDRLTKEELRAIIAELEK